MKILKSFSPKLRHDVSFAFCLFTAAAALFFVSNEGGLLPAQVADAQEGKTKSVPSDSLVISDQTQTNTPVVDEITEQEGKETESEETESKEAKIDDSSDSEAKFLSGTRQLTFEGRRSGEGYFSSDGKQLVFQSEREPGNPFFQIYLMDLEFGDVQRISPGQGKTTCAWIHPKGKKVLFASTQDDPEATAKQKAELDKRAAGTQSRYSWDYDEHYELYEYDTEKVSYKRLSNARGYDAEGSYSPDGSLIAFASNRLAYTDPMTKQEKKLFELNPSNMADIFIMNSDGSNVVRLTKSPGYDGGPFFSPDGKRICWRRFNPTGEKAEIMSMKIDGTDQRQLTQLNVMSWAPYFHPSGEYLIFTTNKHGFDNFELYLVDAMGKSDPVRVTSTDGFDGLPVFTPDGTQLSWTTNRNGSGQSQIYISNWNHQHALNSLRLRHPVEIVATEEAERAAKLSSAETEVDFLPSDIMRHVDYLCRPELGGRMTGSAGERLATAYVAAYLDSLGVVPAGKNGSWFQEFEFPAGVDLGEKNSLTFFPADLPTPAHAHAPNDGTPKVEADKQEKGDTKNQDGVAAQIDKDWLPLSFSKTGEIERTPVVFAGYGIVAPATDEFEEYDSYVHLDVKDKWVMMLRFMPENISAEQRQHFGQFSSVRYKAMVARDKGAKGLILVAGPNSSVKEELIPMRVDGSSSAISLAAISITRNQAMQMLKPSGHTLNGLQTGLDKGSPQMGFELDSCSLAASIDIKRIRKLGRNVLGRLQVTDQPTEQAIVVGAHIDHLGTGPNNSSLAKEEERNGIHFGADDNASGVSAMLEVAQYLADLKRQGKLDGKRDVIFAGWSGEELGLFGSSHFVKNLFPNSPHPMPAYPTIAACLNMDMVGRLKTDLVLQGIGSSSIWKSEIERRNAAVGLSITLQNDSYIPTDAQEFYKAGVPILSAFTGSHSDYHTPRDTPDKLNLEGAAQISRFMALVTRSLVMREDAPDYIKQSQPVQQQRAALRAYLGTIPDYVGEVKGLPLSDVAKGGPADKAGIKGGDVIVELAGKKIENIYDYTYAIEALKIGQKIKVVVMRKDKRIELEITPGSRQ